MTPERRAALEAELDAILGPEPKPPPPKPRVVVRDAEIVRDADVIVSPADPNARGEGRVVKVRRPEPELPPIPEGQVRINLVEAQRQWEIDRQFRLADRAQRRLLDPYNMNLYGPYDD
jgi:hypothetical protein